jgi:hypothetical protein
MHERRSPKGKDRATSTETSSVSGSSETTALARLFGSASRGTIAASNGSDLSERTKEALATNGRSEIESRLNDEDIPRCISFYGGPDPVEDDECPHPLSEMIHNGEGG